MENCKATIRLIACKDFLSESVKSYKDAKRLANRESHFVKKTDGKQNKYDEESTDRLFEELLPLHVTFYSQFTELEEPSRQYV